MSRFRGFFVALFLGFALAMALWGLGALGEARILRVMARPTPEASAPARPQVQEITPELGPGDPALRYVRSLQEGDWNTAVALTEWMQERLDHVKAQSGEGEAVEAAREQLAGQLMQRTLSGNQLRPEGIEDQYVFAPGATVEAALKDEGREDLEEPAAYRVWWRITYPRQDKALRDEASVPVRSLLAAVNISRGGRVLKAGVIGNLEIDRSSATYDWTVRKGE